MRYIYVILSILLVVSCTRPEEAPEFKRVSNIRVNKVTGKEALLNADAYFYNPNDVKMKLRKVDIDVTLEGKKIAKINQSMKTVIPAKSDFKVPVDATFDMKDVGVLKTALSILGGKRMKVHYEGYIRLSVYGIPVKVPVDYEDNVRLN